MSNQGSPDRTASGSRRDDRSASPAFREPVDATANKEQSEGHISPLRDNSTIAGSSPRGSRAGSPPSEEDELIEDDGCFQAPIEESEESTRLQGKASKGLADRYLKGFYLDKKQRLANVKSHKLVEHPMVLPPVLDEGVQAYALQWGANLPIANDNILTELHKTFGDTFHPLLKLHDLAEKAQRNEQGLDPEMVMNGVHHAIRYLSNGIQRVTYHRRASVLRAIDSSVQKKTGFSSFEKRSGFSKRPSLIDSDMKRAIESQPIDDKEFVHKDGKNKPLLFGQSFISDLSSRSETSTSVRKGFDSILSARLGPKAVAAKKSVQPRRDDRPVFSRASTSQSQTRPFFKKGSMFHRDRYDRSLQPYRRSSPKPPSSGFRRPTVSSVVTRPDSRFVDLHAYSPSYLHHEKHEFDVCLSNTVVDDLSSFYSPFPLSVDLKGIDLLPPVGGRLGLFRQNWESMTSDDFVLQAIKGYEIEFAIWPPKQQVLPREIKFSRAETESISEEINQMLTKNAIEEVPFSTDGFISQLFVRPKKDGGLRPIINLRGLNQFIQYEHFKMENLAVLKGLIQRNDFLAKIDLKDAYLTVPIALEFRKFLRFTWKTKLYQFRCLCFGLASAPKVFTKILKPVLSIWRRQGIRCLVYLDDCLFLDSDAKQLQNTIKFCTRMLQNLGFLINWEKSEITPQCKLEFLGLEIDTVSLRFLVPNRKLLNLKSFTAQLIAVNQVQVRDLARFLGLVTSMTIGLAPGSAFARNVQLLLIDSLHKSGSFDSYVVLTEAARDELKTWLLQVNEWNGRDIIRPQPDLIITTDSSLTGWGAVCNGKVVSGLWTRQEKAFHINVLELKAAFLAIKCFVGKQSNVHVLLQSDNVSTVVYLNKQGGTKSIHLCELAVEIWKYCLERSISLEAVHIAGVENDVADQASRRKAEHSDWMLDREIFSQINHRLGPCSIDLFAARHNAQLPVFYSWKVDPDAKAVDAIAQSWSKKGVLYAFPPFSLISRIVDKLVKEEATVVLVAPVWPAQPWYPQLLQKVVQPPLLLPLEDSLLTDSVGEFHPLVLQKRLRLGVWKLSASVSQQRDFQKTLSALSKETSQHLLQSSTIQLLKNGIAGVYRNKLIRFIHL